MQTVVVTAVAVLLALFVWEQFLRKQLVRSGTSNYDYEQSTEAIS